MKNMVVNFPKKNPLYDDFMSQFVSFRKVTTFNRFSPPSVVDLTPTNMSESNLTAESDSPDSPHQQKVTDYDRGNRRPR